MVADDAVTRQIAEYGQAFERRGIDYFNFFFHISFKYKYVYCATPKVGCSTIIHTLQRAEFESDTFLHDPWQQLHHRRFSPLLTPLQTPSFKSIIENDSFIKFCFVRNPYSRLVSCYLDKIREGGLSHIFLEKLGRNSGIVEFEEFIDIIANESREEMESHYALQFDITYQDFIKYNFIGKFEQFQDDLSIFGKMSGIDINKYGVNILFHATNEKYYTNFLTPKIVDFINERYDKDFDHFGYEKIHL